MKKIPLIFLVVSLLPAIVLASSLKISKGQFSGDWPLTIDSGLLNCELSSVSPNLQLVTFTSNGKTYALNSTARGQSKNRGWLEVNQVWKENTSIPSTKVSIGPLIDRGLALCK